MKYKRLIIGFFIVAGLSLGGFWVYSQYLAPGTDDDGETATTPAAGSDITGSDIVTAEGRIVPRDFISLAFTGSGQVQEIFVSAGQLVAKGDPLVQLDTADQENGVAQAEAALRQAQANLSSSEAALQVGQANLNAAGLGVAVAAANYDLLAAPATPEQLALSAAAVAAAEAGVSAAGGSLALVTEGSSTAQISAAQANLAAAEAQYNTALRSFQPVLQNEDADATAQELAQFQLTAAQANYQAAQATLADLTTGASNAQRFAASSAVASASNEVDAASANYELLLIGTREERLAVAQTEILQAENRVKEAELELNAAETTIVQANAAITEAELALELAREALADRTLSAAMAGVVAAVDTKTGEFASPGFPVITIADYSAWQIETTDLTELNIVGLRLDDTATISIDAFANEELSGQVSKISPTAIEVLGDVTYIVTLTLPETTLPLRWGMTVFVTFDS